MAGNSVIHGDCLAVMREMPAASVDLILTDPPYFKVKNDWWDRQWEKPAAFLAWVDELCQQWQRVLKPNGSLYVFASPQMASRVELQIAVRFCVLNRIAWRKPPFSTRAEICVKQDLRSYFSASEAIIFAEQTGADSQAKGDSGWAAKLDELRADVFAPLREWLVTERYRAGATVDDINRSCGVSCMASHYFSRSQWALPTEDHFARMRQAFPGFFVRDYEELRAQYEELRAQYEELRAQYEELRAQYEELRRPFFLSADVPYTDVWDFATVNHYPGKHSCEKPQALLRHIISTSSRLGDVVLDCFAGSGATLVAAKALGRQAIGIEIDERWCDYARDRIDPPQMSLLGVMP